MAVWLKVPAYDSYDRSITCWHFQNIYIITWFCELGCRSVSSWLAKWQKTSFCCRLPFPQHSRSYAPKFRLLSRAKMAVLCWFCCFWAVGVRCWQFCSSWYLLSYNVGLNFSWCCPDWRWGIGCWLHSYSGWNIFQIYFRAFLTWE